VSESLEIVPNPAPSDIVIKTGGKMLVRISKDGELEYGEDYTPDAAAKAFWSAIAGLRQR